MKKKKIIAKKLCAALLLSTLSFGAEYLIPPNYDNVSASNDSSQIALLGNTSAFTLGIQGTIGGKTLQYRCLSVPKIDCRASTPAIIANISEVSLKEPLNHELVNVYTTDIITVDAGANFGVCGAAVGGMTWDTAALQESNNVNGDKVLTFTYDPNSKSEIYYYFTSDPKSGSDRSYMVIETKQMCQ